MQEISYSTIDSIIADFEEETRIAATIQTDVLKQILHQNGGTEYLRNCGLGGRTDAQSFKRYVPLVTHADLKPYFDRIVEGDRSAILTRESIQTLSLSSGTTADGQQKYLVLYKEILEATVQLAKISSAYRARAFPIRSGGRVLELAFSGNVSTTSGGLTSGTATTHLFRSKEFKLKQESADVLACSPDEVIRAWDNRQAMYCHLLSALLCREELEFITSAFAYTIVEAFRTFELQWQNLCNDIRHGQLSSSITDPSVRSAMAKLLKPDPELADMLVSKCSALDDWSGVIPQIWPNCKYIYSIMTGSMETYLKRLHHYAGSLPLVSGDYGATESWIGVNASPKAQPRDVTFTVVPSFAYFEFIPIPSKDPEKEETSAAEEEEPSPVGLTEVEVGHEYEIVMTTYGGLYRYRLGDIVRVTSFFNASPQLAYVCRKNVLLTVNIDKNTEKDLQIAVNKGVDKLQQHDSRAELVDFTSYADLSTTPGHYVVFWELSSSRNRRDDADDDGDEKRGGMLLDEGVLQRCATSMDLAFVDPGYVGSRKVRTIGQLELCLLEPGTFRFLLDRYLKRGRAITQYKTPRCIASEDLRMILRTKVCAFALSSAYL